MKISSVKWHNLFLPGIDAFASALKSLLKESKWESISNRR